MNSLSTEEKTALVQAVKELRSMAAVVEAIADLTPTDDGPVGLADLRPSGRLDSVADEIRNNTPISNEDLEVLIAAAQKDIKFNSRLNGFLVNMTAVASSLRTTVLPLLMTAGI